MTTTTDTSSIHPESAEALLAQELNKLTVRERESIQEEIHGIGVGGAFNKNDDDEMAASLFGLHKELVLLCCADNNHAQDGSNNSNNNKPLLDAYRRSQSLRRSYFQDDPELRKMFLRCEHLDCRRAAIRLCHYANLVYDLFGEIGLERRIELSDYSEEEISIMKWGTHRVLQSRDRAGRKVYVKFHSELWDMLPLKTRMRIVHYFILSMVHGDIDAQKKGIVVTIWMHDECDISIDTIRSRQAFYRRLSTAMPFLCGAAHYLFSSVSNNTNTNNSEQIPSSLAMGKTISVMDRKYMPYVRIHRGSPIECLSVLETFGIPSKEIPLDINTGKLDLAQSNRWLEEELDSREQQQPLLQNNNSTTITTIIEDPNDFDVLLGRGRQAMGHPGNTAFRRCVDMWLETYARIRGRKATMEWTFRVLRTFQTKYGTRFLKAEKTSDAWVEVSDVVARNKIRVAFRDAKMRQQQRASRCGAMVAAEPPWPANSNSNGGSSSSNTTDAVRSRQAVDDDNNCSNSLWNLTGGSIRTE